ncbi:MAG: hypothetical protein HYZ08_00350 [Candidatus Kerfeldbacteria bacterium]|nr:hypothetical protein [Candidatus Kerfeldbacteria bacterium]
MKRIVQILLSLLLILLLLTVEWSIFPSLFSDHFIYFFLLISIALLSIGRDREALVVVLIGALAHDVFSPLSFGVMLFSYGATILLCKLLLIAKFTEHSILSLMVVATAGMLSFHIAMIVADVFSSMIAPTSAHLRLWDWETYAAFVRVIWTNLAVLVILRLGSLLVRRLLNPYLRLYP